MVSMMSVGGKLVERVTSAAVARNPIVSPRCPRMSRSETLCGWMVKSRERNRASDIRSSTRCSMRLASLKMVAAASSGSSIAWSMIASENPRMEVRGVRRS